MSFLSVFKSHEEKREKACIEKSCPVWKCHRGTRMNAADSSFFLFCYGKEKDAIKSFSHAERN